jgi:hypothetical protein
MEDHIFQRGRRNDQGWTRLPILSHILRCIDPDHAGDLFGRAGINTLDAGVGVVTAHKGRMKHIGQVHIIYE